MKQKYHQPPPAKRALEAAGQKPRAGFIYAAGILAGLLMVVGLVRLAWHYTQPEPINQARALERMNAQMELAAENQRALSGYGWIDQSRGIVRIPMTNAMDLLVLLWQDPQAGRSNLLSRVERATAKFPK